MKHDISIFVYVVFCLSRFSELIYIYYNIIVIRTHFDGTEFEISLSTKCVEKVVFFLFQEGKRGQTPRPSKSVKRKVCNTSLYVYVKYA